MLYWNNIELNNTINIYNPQKKYIICNPWNGGFNNVRMSFEIAACIALRLQRILVIPDAYEIYLLKNMNGFDTFFELKDIGITILTATEFCKTKNIPKDLYKIWMMF